MRRPLPLTGDHDLAEFDSGEASLDDWLRGSALDAQARGTARTFVVEDLGRIVGYYSLAAHVVTRDELLVRLGRGNPARIPAVFLARFAIDLGQQGRGLGSALLGDAFNRVVDVTREVGARYLVADALHEKAADFYVHHGFVRVPNTLRLVRKVSAIAADLDR